MPSNKPASANQGHLRLEKSSFIHIAAALTETAGQILRAAAQSRHLKNDPLLAAVSALRKRQRLIHFAGVSAGLTARIDSSPDNAATL